MRRMAGKLCCLQVCDDDDESVLQILCFHVVSEPGDDLAWFLLPKINELAEKLVRVFWLPDFYNATNFQIDAAEWREIGVDTAATTTTCILFCC